MESHQFSVIKQHTSESSMAHRRSHEEGQEPFLLEKKTLKQHIRICGKKMKHGGREGMHRHTHLEDEKKMVKLTIQRSS